MNATLLLGSNLGNAKANLETAISELENYEISILKKSEFLVTKPVEFVSSNNFCNIALSIKTQLSPIKLLNCVKEIERKMGRTFDSKDFGSYTDRLIDIDIVLYEGLVFSSERLEIPHQKNAFQREFSKKLISSL